MLVNAFSNGAAISSAKNNEVKEEILKALKEKIEKRDVFDPSLLNSDDDPKKPIIIIINPNPKAKDPDITDPSDPTNPSIPKSADLNGDGIITQYELVNSGYETLGTDFGIDEDENGIIDFEEYNKGTIYTCDMVELTKEEALEYTKYGIKPHKDNGKYYVNRGAEAMYEFYTEDISDQLDNDKNGTISDDESIIGYIRAFTDYEARN